MFEAVNYVANQTISSHSEHEHGCQENELSYRSRREFFFQVVCHQNGAVRHDSSEEKRRLKGENL